MKAGVKNGTVFFKILLSKLILFSQNKYYFNLSLLVTPVLCTHTFLGKLRQMFLLVSGRHNCAPLRYTNMSSQYKAL